MKDILISLSSIHFKKLNECWSCVKPQAHPQEILWFGGDLTLMWCHNMQLIIIKCVTVLMGRIISDWLSLLNRRAHCTIYFQLFVSDMVWNSTKNKWLVSLTWKIVRTIWNKGPMQKDWVGYVFNFLSNCNF